jgi:hypothetical protein
MDVNMAFLNGDLYKKITWHNPKVFVMEVKERMGCRLQKSTMGKTRL